MYMGAVKDTTNSGKYDAAFRLPPVWRATDAPIGPGGVPSYFDNTAVQAWPVTFTPDVNTPAATDGLRDRFGDVGVSSYPVQYTTAGVEIALDPRVPTWFWWGLGGMVALTILTRPRSQLGRRKSRRGRR